MSTNQFMDILHYLFECHFADGTVLLQTPEDVSQVDPTKSAFYDVAQRLSDVVIFGLVNDDHTYAVDLRDGHFEIDGVPFNIGGKDQLPTADCVYRLIYFRRHVRQVTLGYEGEDHSIEYHFGWQTTIDGENYQRTIAMF